MKSFFLVLLLVNIVLFLWEFNSGALKVNNTDIDDKQILLLSEVKNNELRARLMLAGNTIDFNEAIVTAELKALLTNRSKQAKRSDNNPMFSAQSNKLFALKKKKLDDDLLPLTSSKKEKEKVYFPEKSTQKPNTQHELLDTVVTEEANLSKTQKAEENGTHSDKVCYKIGPFNTQNELDNWRQLHNVKANSLSEVDIDSLINSRYLVYIPAADNFAKSKKNAQMLEKKGITDFWLFRKGELKGAISLGLFIKKNRALSLQEKLTERGVNSAILRRQKNESVLYAQVLTADKDFAQSISMTKTQRLTRCE